MGHVRIVFIVIASLLLSHCSKKDDTTSTSMENTFTYEAGLKSYAIQWEGRTRTYLVYYPLAIHKDKALPVLFAIHGGVGTAQALIAATRNRFNELADTDGVIVVYPEGFEKQWNDGRDVEGIVTAWDENINDVGFITNIIARLEVNLNVNSSRIFTTGISNGDFMSSRLLCDRSNLFRGGAIVTATLSENYSSNCQPATPNAVLVINGTEDPLVPYEGGQVVVLGQERGEVLGTEAYMHFLATHNGCDTTPTITDLVDMEDDGTTVQIYEYTNCSSSKLQLYRVEGGGHTWPGSIDFLGENLVGKTSREFVACDVIWDFFSDL